MCKSTPASVRSSTEMLTEKDWLQAGVLSVVIEIIKYVSWTATINFSRRAQTGLSLPDRLAGRSLKLSQLSHIVEGQAASGLCVRLSSTSPPMVAQKYLVLGRRCIMDCWGA